jgi:hypothetical protein
VIGRSRLRAGRVRAAATYSVNEIVVLRRVHPNTVRRWFRRGLRPIDDSRPLLVLGAELSAFLGALRSARRQKCQPDEFFCFSCQSPRRPRQATVTIEVRNTRLLDLHGRCEVCGTRMNRAGSIARLSEYEDTFAAFMPRDVHIGVPGLPTDNGVFKKELEDDPIQLAE